jgi:hypothetical protein
MEVTVNVTSINLGCVAAPTLDKLAEAAEARALETFGPTGHTYDLAVEHVSHDPGGEWIAEHGRTAPKFKGIVRATKRPFYAPQRDTIERFPMEGGTLEIDTRTAWDDLNDRITRIEAIIAKGTGYYEQPTTISDPVLG